MASFPRIYRTFQEFSRHELRKLDSLHTTVDDMLQERFAEELDFDAEESPRNPGRPRKRSGGINFDY